MKLSGIVLTRNSSESLTRCLNSLFFCDEIIVIVDTDTSTSLKLPSEAKLYVHPLDEDFSAQRNFGLTKAKGDWLLFVDDDEEITHELMTEITEVISQSSNPVQGYYFKRSDVFMGKSLEHGETASIKLLRLAKKGAGKWKGEVHEEWDIKGETSTLTYPLLHNRFLSVHELFDRINWYTDIRATELYKHKTQEPAVMLFIKPVAKFIDNYILKSGFSDGFPGLAFAFIMSWHSLLVRIKLRLLWMNKGSFNFKIS